MNHSIQQSLAVAALIVSFGAMGYSMAGWAKSQPVLKVKVVKLSAKRYEFTPNHLTLKKGQSVDFELVSQDVLMGFNVPDMGKRADIIPGQVTHLRLTPQKLGTYAFLCDIFCGSGHEDMNGTMTVVE